MKVYLLITGEDEDEAVAGVFTSIEKLNEFKNTFESTEGYIRDPIEIELDFFPNSDQSMYRVVCPENNPITSSKVDISSISHRNKIYGSKKYRWVCVLASSYNEANELGKKLFEKQDMENS